MGGSPRRQGEFVVSSGCRAPGAPALLVALLSPYAVAQVPPAAPVPLPSNAQSLDMRYTGSNARIGIGYDTQNKLRGDAYYLFGETERTAWIGELWYSQRDAGGVQASYHWLPADAGPDTGVRKLFVAADQNEWRDRKITVGGGYEVENWFASGYAAAGVTGRRQVSFEQQTTTSTITSSDTIGPFEQDIFTTVTTRQFDRAYNWGVGGRVGRFWDSTLVRLNGGVDYEWGVGSASQTTLSVGVEKFFPGSPISIGLVGEAYWKHGDLSPERNDQRLTVMLRYEFDGPAWRPAKQYRNVAVDMRAVSPAPAPMAATPTVPTTRIEQRMVKTTASAASDAFFGFDQAAIQPDARAALDAAATRLRQKDYEGNIRISGHTCDLGPAAYNLKLSQRRADAVKAYLVAAGVPAARIVSEGVGETAPRYPNDAAGRPKNRRVDIEFVTFEDKAVDVAVSVPAPAPSAAAAPEVGTPQVQWRQEEITSEPTWLRRALHNPAQHKQQVDVYRTQEQATTIAAGEKRYINQPPVAVNDAYTVEGNSANSFDVLANDSDPDGNPLTLAALTQPAHGTATITGNRIVYVPATGYAGSDTFTYTVSDGKGLFASASVAVSVKAIAIPNRAPVANKDSAYVLFNTPREIFVLRNDTDADGDPLTIVSFTQPPIGQVTLTDHGTFIYRVNDAYVGNDTFTYTISDGRGGTSTATVYVFVDP